MHISDQYTSMIYQLMQGMTRFSFRISAFVGCGDVVLQDWGKKTYTCKTIDKIKWDLKYK